KKVKRGNLYPEKYEIYVQGVDLNDHGSRQHFKKRIEISIAALDAIRPILLAELDGIQAEIPEFITGFPPMCKREDIVRCGHCGWEGRDSLTGVVPAYCRERKF